MADTPIRTCPECKLAEPTIRFNKGCRQCNECKKKYLKEWYKKNRAHALLYATNWRKNNRDRRNAYTREWNKAHPATPEQKKRRANRELKHRYGKHWEAYRIYWDIMKILKEIPGIELLDTEIKRGKERRTNGYYKNYYKQRKARDPHYNEKRKAREQQTTRVRRKRLERNQEQSGADSKSIKDG